MTGFWLLAALYACMWAIMLAPGAVVLLARHPRPRLPEDDPVDDAWVRVLRRELLTRVHGAVQPNEVPFLDRMPRRARAEGRAVLRVAGSLTIPDGAVVEASLIVHGDLRCGAGARLLGPSWVRGRARLGPRARATTLVVDGECRLDEGASVTGGVASGGSVRVDRRAQVSGPVLSRRQVVLRPGAVVGSALAPVVRCASEPGQEELVPLSEAQPLKEPVWTPRLDAALTELWPGGRLAELVEALAERTGELRRGSHVLARARQLGLFDRGIPRPPAVLGRRPRWVLEPETVRVGADLRVPPGVVVSYALAVEGSLEVFQDAELERPVRAGRGILLHARAHCFAQVASDGLIVVEEGAAVLGPADSSTHILLFANARVGTPGSGGAHARGAIGLEPGARVIGGAISGLGVRGEELRSYEQRVEQIEKLPDAKDIRRPAAPPEAAKGKGKPRRRRRRRGHRPAAGQPVSAEQPVVHDLSPDQPVVQDLAPERSPAPDPADI
ncbi:MAG TPA: hypothetical protein VM840_02335 [Actinomycetota bacterium]|nr:hypothetical protein [Actinomycetota bacterium]